MNMERFDDNTLIAAYLHNRDVVLEDIKRQTLEATQPILDEQKMIEEELGRRLLERKAQNTSTDSGCAFFQGWSSLKTTDKSSWVRWVIGGEHWAYADIRPMKSEIEGALEKDKDFELPPGLTLEQGQKVHVRKG